MDRRDFLKKTGALATSASLGPWVGACNSSSGNGSTDSGRLAITMWEFSWLVRRQGAEAEYADWDKVLDELAERGYDTIRLDAFPHLIARGPDGDLVERFTVLPQSPLFMWGNHEPVEIDPRAGLVEFLSKVRERDMGVGLSTWFNDDTLARSTTVVTPDDYARIWGETLDFLADSNSLDVVRWVDLCNEFPLGKWAKGAAPVIFDIDDPSNLMPVFSPWTDDTLSRVQPYLDEGIGPLREAYPELLYTFSFETTSAENVRQLDTRSFDIGEVHVWLSNDLVFSTRSGQGAVVLESGPEALPRHAEQAPEVYFSERDMWLSSLEGLIGDWTQWGADNGLPLYTSECWGPINYDDVDSIPGTTEWDWVKDVCAEGVGMAIEQGWVGICSHNFTQPHFEGMWSDIAWHQEQTNLIRNA